MRTGPVSCPFGSVGDFHISTDPLVRKELVRSMLYALVVNLSVGTAKVDGSTRELTTGGRPHERIGGRM